MKPQYIKFILLILIALPIVTTAESQNPSEETKRDFANCVVTENKAWSECYHHLHSGKNSSAENNDPEKTKPSTDYYAPRWVYRILPTYNPPDFDGERLRWNSESTAANTSN